MKKEGDAAVTVLVQAFCSIYSNEGYYVMAGDLFYDDLADNLYQEDSDYVRRVIALAVEYGLFDSALFQEYGLLTSADIQRQFLFATKRRNVSLIDTRYCLLSSSELTPSTQEEKESGKPALKDVEEKKYPKDENAVVIPINATFSPENSENTHFDPRRDSPSTATPGRDESQLRRPHIQSWTLSHSTRRAVCHCLQE